MRPFCFLNLFAKPDNPEGYLGRFLSAVKTTVKEKETSDTVIPRHPRRSIGPVPSVEVHMIMWIIGVV